MTTMMTDPGATDLVADEARKYIRDVAGRIAEHGVTAIEQSVLIGDHPAQILLDVAKAHDIDLIALATHGRGMSRLVLGSVADKLLRGSTTPLLVSARKPGIVQCGCAPEYHSDVPLRRLAALLLRPSCCI